MKINYEKSTFNHKSKSSDFVLNRVWIEYTRVYEIESILKRKRSSQKKKIIIVNMYISRILWESRSKFVTVDLLIRGHRRRYHRRA